MAKKDSINIEVDLFKQADYRERLTEARLKAVEAAGMVWSDTTKELTRNEDHIDTSLYVNSIGYITNTPATNKSGKGEKQATQDDVIYDIKEESDKTALKIGSNVSYAEHLEKRFSLMARGLDIAKPRMKAVADFQVKKALGLK